MFMCVELYSGHGILTEHKKTRKLEIEKFQEENNGFFAVVVRKFLQQNQKTYCMNGREPECGREKRRDSINKEKMVSILLLHTTYIILQVFITVIVGL